MLLRSIVLFLLFTNLIDSSFGYDIEVSKIEVLDDKFLVSVLDDPDIKWVQMNVNVNKQFESFEQGQFTCSVSHPKNRRWTCEFQKEFVNTDILYMWIGVLRDHFRYREKKGGYAVGAIRRGDANFMVPTTTKAPATSNNDAAAMTNRIDAPSNGGTSSTATDQCQPTISEISNGGKLCKGDLIFEDNFDQFNSSHWINDISIPTTNSDAEFSFYNGSISFNEGVLIVEASVYAKDTTKGTLDLLDRCTASNINECRFDVKNSFFPPISSGRINTKHKFEFKYGRIEVRARMPIGDWLFPLISLQTAEEKYGQDDYDNGEMRIAYVRGNQDIPWSNTNIGGERLFGGVILNKNPDSRTQYMSNVTLAEVNGVNEHFGKAFHTYALTWTKDELILSVDGFEYGKMSADFKNAIQGRSWRRSDPVNAPLDQKFYITLGLAAGGHGDFPDNIRNKKWENTSPKAILHFFNDRSTWSETWAKPVLEVDYVRVYAV